MKITAPKIIFSAICVFFSILVSAACLPIQGTVETQSIDGSEQIGIISMTSSSSSAFRKAFRQISITGGIKGTITSQSGNTVYLHHEIGFPGVGSIISSNDVAQITGVDDEGNLLVTETVPLAAAPPPYNGEFKGWTGELVATGTLNVTTNTNTFIYSGNIHSGNNTCNP